MRFVLVVGVLIWSSVIVVSEESIETSSEEFPELQVFNDTVDMESELEPSSLGTQLYLGLFDPRPPVRDSIVTPRHLFSITELALTKSGKSSYLRYEGFEIGCYNKLCFRRKWKTSSRWGYIEDWEEQGKTGKNKQLVPCKDHQFCLDYVKQRPGDFPCYKSIWSHHPCYKGRRYGCRRMGFPFESMKRCWHEILTPPYYWAYSHIAFPVVDCSRDEYCKEESSLFIDWLEEF